MNDNKKLVAVVTGASRGIGYAIATYLASKGYKLLLIARKLENLQVSADEIVAKFPGMAFQPSIAAIDVSDYEKVKSVVNDFAKEQGQIDILCNSAGYVKRGSSELSYDEFIKMINTNLIGAFNCIQTVVPYMKEKKSGRIINIASRSGKIARKQLGGYAASKFGIIGLNEAIYKELAEYGIYVTAICPNLVATDMTSDVDMAKHEMIQTNDIVKSVDYILSLSPSVAIKEILLQCRAKLIEE
ncbi:MAG: SDR family NAD(P)-dependent oxidoreductase [Gammaproteobacteria bacterium]|nr:SDR family NAD(P)-dependent oxidoreductase [Gammaproteobacteria bacterium]